MPEQSIIQMKLRRTEGFLDRLQYFLVQIAIGVLAEVLNTPHHAERAAYAKTVINASSGAAQSASVVVVGGVNIIANTTYDQPTDTVANTTSDAAFLSQVSSLWNVLSGVETGA